MDHRISFGAEGVLPRQDIWEMVKDGLIDSPFKISQNQCQPASLDLRVGEKGYRVQCSFLPDKDPVKHKLNQHTIYPIDLTKEGVVLEPGAVYVIELMEHLNLPKRISAKANPRSTTGRLDIFTRVITDRSDGFDVIAENYQGPLYLEVITRSFPVRIERWMSLSQIRFIRGNPRCTDEDIRSLYKEIEILHEGDSPVSFAEVILRQGLYLRVDLTGKDRLGLVGYKARRSSRLIDLRRINYYEVFDFWEPVFKDSSDHLILEAGEFYLLTSKDKVRIPPTHAAEMVAYEQGSGELRTHYAGFFDPGFGYGSHGEVMGTVAVMEVRALDAPFMIEDGQRFCKLQLEKMAAMPDHVYGEEKLGSSYQFQSLTPSKHFRSPSAKEIRKRARGPESLSLPLSG